MTAQTPKIPQRVLVFNHLKTHGYITDILAQSYGIRRLASRIEELKINDIGISVEMRRDDLGRRYAYYTLTPTDCGNPFPYCLDMAAKVPQRRAA